MLRKTVVWLSLILLLVSNNMFAYQSAFEYTLQPSTGNAPGSSDNNSSANSAVGAGNSIVNTYIDQATQNSDIDWLRRLNLDVYYDLTAKTWLYDINTIQPFAFNFDPSSKDMWFFQLNASKTNTDLYANGGLGYRLLSADKKSMYGISAFYDRDFNNPFQRVGLGLEYFNRLFELRANGYYGISNAVLTSQDSNFNYYQTVVNGVDYGASLNVPYAEWLKLSATGYNNFQKYTPKTGGVVLGATAQLLPQVKLSYGYNMASGTSATNSQAVGFQLDLGGFLGPALLGMSNADKAIVDKDLSYKLLQPVVRNNAITTEKYQKARYGQLQVTVHYSDGTNVPDGTDVQVIGTSLGGPSYTQPTTGGVAAFSNIAGATTYNISAIINGAPCYSTINPVNVALDVTTTALINSASNPNYGTANVTLQYSDGGPIVGQTVTLTNGTVTMQAVTNGTGLASFFGLAAGSYTATTVINSYTFTSGTFSVAVGGTATPTVTGPNNPQDGSMQVTLSYSDGTQASGGPYTGTYQSQATGSAAHTFSIVGGVATIPNIIPGAYDVIVSMNGHDYAPVTTPTVTSGNIAQVAITGSNNPYKGEIIVTVNGADGQPIPGQVVAASSTFGGASGTAVTGVDGKADVANLPIVDGHGVPYAYNISTVFQSIIFQSSGGAIAVSAGTPSTASINLRYGTINLQVRYGDGSPVADQPVIFSGLDALSGFAQTYTTNDSGNIAATDIPVGDYNIYTTLYGVRYNSAPSIVHVSNSSSITVNMSLTPNPADVGTMIVTAKYGNGVAMSGWVVVIVDATNTNRRTVLTDSAGVATCTIPVSGSYYAYIRNSSDDPFPPVSPADYVANGGALIVCQVGATANASITGPAAPTP